MGHRLHSAIKYEVKYGDCAFNYAQPHINPIIEVLAEGDCCYEGDFLDYADTLSASREKLVKNVEYIKVTESDWKVKKTSTNSLKIWRMMMSVVLIESISTRNSKKSSISPMKITNMCILLGFKRHASYCTTTPKGVVFYLHVS